MKVKSVVEVVCVLAVASITGIAILNMYFKNVNFHIFILNLQMFRLGPVQENCHISRTLIYLQLILISATKRTIHVILAIYRVVERQILHMQFVSIQQSDTFRITTAAPV